MPFCIILASAIGEFPGLSTEDSSNVERAGGWYCGQQHPAPYGLFRKIDRCFLAHTQNGEQCRRQREVCLCFCNASNSTCSNLYIFPFWPHNNVCISLKNQYSNAKDGSCHTGCSMHRN